MSSPSTQVIIDQSKALNVALKVFSLNLIPEHNPFVYLVQWKKTMNEDQENKSVGRLVSVYLGTNCGFYYAAEINRCTYCNKMGWAVKEKSGACKECIEIVSKSGSPKEIIKVLFQSGFKLIKPFDDDGNCLYLDENFMKLFTCN
jgi:hypothetical protein